MDGPVCVLETKRRSRVGTIETLIIYGVFNLSVPSSYMWCCDRLDSFDLGPDTLLQ